MPSLHHVAIQTNDLDNCLAWYRDFLGWSWSLTSFSALTRRRLPGIRRLVEVRLGDARLHVFERDRVRGRPPRAKTTSFQHLCFVVDEPDLDWLRARWTELCGSGRYRFASPDPPDRDRRGPRRHADVLRLRRERPRAGVQLPTGRRIVTAPTSVFTRIPACDEWDFGGFPYGLGDAHQHPVHEQRRTGITRLVVPGPTISRPRSARDRVGPVLGAPDPGALASFYAHLLGWRIVEKEPDWVRIKPDDGGPGLSFQHEANFRRPVWPESPEGQQMMMHLDIAVEDLDAGVAWALSAGAVLAEYQPQDNVRVLFDPAGHPFDLFHDGT